MAEAMRESASCEEVLVEGLNCTSEYSWRGIKVNRVTYTRLVFAKFGEDDQSQLPDCIVSLLLTYVQPKLFLHPEMRHPSNLFSSITSTLDL